MIGSAMANVQRKRFCGQINLIWRAGARLSVPLPRARYKGPQRYPGKQHLSDKRMIPVIPTGSAFSACTSHLELRTQAAERKNDLGRDPGANDQFTSKTESAGGR